METSATPQITRDAPAQRSQFTCSLRTILGKHGLQHVGNGGGGDGETEIGDGQQTQVGEERDCHGDYRADDETVAREQGDGAPDGARAEIADLAVAAHAGRLHHFTHGGGAHDDGDENPLHRPASGCGAAPSRSRLYNRLQV